MKPSLLVFMLIALCLNGCMNTSQTTQEVASTVIDTAESLHIRHIQTIDAYIKSLEAAKSDTERLLNAIQGDRKKIVKLKKQIMSMRAEILIGKALQSYHNQAQEDIFSKLDQQIEANFWPEIVAQHAVYRDRADAFGEEIKAHPCNNRDSGCTSISATNFNMIQTKYRDSSVAAEYILHLGYEQETLIWQNAIESYQKQTKMIEAEVFRFLAKQPNELNISVTTLANELTQVDNKFAQTITQLKREKAQIEQHWASTKGAMQLLQKEISKPAVWKLILKGASTQTKGILAGYSSNINQAVSGIFGSDIGKIMGDRYQKKVMEIAGSGFEKLELVINKTIDKATSKVTKSVDEFSHSGQN
ncbi:hypothetical protein [Pseudoalteromonas aurantia]|uniref:Lipoprotein n=1 Tax=Pseudoalteromonas aurantia 208 TaxID=1314867 RepID=A0ABR9EDI8_9GAMM|nr:hypothetical protein [Pseudoalteromonas aurantia]MBE0369051.1 hypothetical protein [Pseudoalteromonas aurantia 208]